MELHEYDILILGSGIAGFSAAVHASAESGGKARIAVISKLHAMRSHSVSAEGGISGVLYPVHDSKAKHAYDTVKGSDYLADQDAVEQLVEGAPEEIRFFEHLGVPWHRENEGQISFRPFGGMSTPRTAYAADKTGFFMMRALYDELTSMKNVDIFHEHFATKLITRQNRCIGICAMDLADSTMKAFVAKSCILATGGFSRIYPFTTTAHSSTGDGTALAYEAGLPLKDMEFVQFHPTAIVPSGILITEAARGEGGRLLNAKKERFMKRYAPSVMELAPRDIVSRAIMTELDEGRGFEGKDGLGYVHLDLTHLGARRIDEKLPMIKDICMKMLGIDPGQEPIPVRPATHFTMGGINTDIEGRVIGRSGRFPVAGLWAAGECGCVSVHGANRLGSNSLSQCAVWGRKTGIAAAKHAKRAPLEGRNTAKKVAGEEEKRIDSMLSRQEGEDPYAIRDEMHDVMEKNLYVYRTLAGMREAKARLSRIKPLLKRMAVRDRGMVYNTNLRDALEINNLVSLADAVVTCAMKRTESRGAHAMKEFPKRDDAKWLKHSVIARSTFGPRVSYTPVKITKWQPKERKY